MKLKTHINKLTAWILTLAMLMTFMPTFSSIETGLIAYALDGTGSDSDDTEFGGGTESGGDTGSGDSSGTEGNGTAVSYLAPVYENGEIKLDEYNDVVFETEMVTDYIVAEDIAYGSLITSAEQMPKIGTSGETTWHVANSDIEWKNFVLVQGDVHLIICDDVTIKSVYGIIVSEGNSLTIYGQENGTGMLAADGLSYSAGFYSAAIGGCDITTDLTNSGSITINGGEITAAGSPQAAAIGGGNRGNGGEITINGGTVDAEGGANSAAIGGGSGGNSGIITINGGNVTATKGTNGSAIGTGYVRYVYNNPDDCIYAKADTISINGGTVVANITSNSSSTCPAIGGDFGFDNISISGGHITINHGRSDGIGIGTSSATAMEFDGNLNISGGTIISGTDYQLSIGSRASSSSPKGTVDVVVTGGNISGTIKNPTTLTDGTNNVVQKEFTLVGAENKTPVTAVEGYEEYGLTDVVTDDDKLTIYVAEKGEPESIKTDENTYLEAADGVYGVEGEKILSFNANGGTGAMSSITFSGSESKTLPVNEFTRSYYEFTGWNTSPEGNGTSYEDCESINITENTVLYAQWEQITYNVTFNPGDGTGTMEDDTAYAAASNNYTLPECTFNPPEGKLFRGWKVGTSSTIRLPGTKVKVSADTTVTAVWGEPIVEVTVEGVTTKYPSLEQVIPVVRDKTAEIKVIKEFSVTSSINIYANELVIDLNGYTISGYIFSFYCNSELKGPGTINVSNQLRLRENFRMAVGENVNITRTSGTSSTSYAVQAYGGATLILNGGSVTCNSTTAPAIYSTGTAVVVNADGVASTFNAPNVYYNVTPTTAPANSNTNGKIWYRIDNFISGADVTITDGVTAIYDKKIYGLAGQMVTIVPNAGYTLADVKVNGNDATAVSDNYTFSMPAGVATLTGIASSSHHHNWSYEKNGTTIIATCTADDCPNRDGGSVTIAVPDSLTYTGEAIETKYTNTLKTDDTITVVYTPADKLTDGKPVNAGEYTASITVGGVIASVNFEITAKSLSGAVVMVDSNANLGYTGNAITPDVSVTLDGTALTTDDYTVSYSGNTNVGQATITVTGKGNYKDTASTNFTITKATPVVTAPTAKTGLIYTSEAQELVNVGNTTGGTIQYSLDNVTYSTNIPTGTNAGTYTVYYKVIGNDNYNDVAASSVGVTISPKTVANPTFDSLVTTQIYTGSAIEPTFTLKDGDTVIPENEYDVEYSNNTNVGEATITITDKENGNYTVSGSAKFTIAMHSHDWSYSVSDYIITATCGAEGCTLSESKCVALVEVFDDEVYNPGGYTECPVVYSAFGWEADKIVIVNKGFSNVDGILRGYAAIEICGTQYGEFPYTIRPATNAFTTTPAAVENLKYTGSAQALVTEGVVKGGTVQYKLSNGEWSNSAPAMTEVGTYAVYYRAVGNAYFTDIAETEVSVTISKAELTALTGAPADQKLTDYYTEVGGAIAELPTTVTYETESGNVTIAIQWTCENYNSATKATNSFAWFVKTGELDNYDVNGIATSGTITVTNMDALSVTNTGSDAEITYDGNTYDVSKMFTKGTGTGEATYTIVGGDGEGTLNGSVLIITKAGTIQIKLATAANGAYAAGEATATLTVAKSNGTGTVSMEGWTYGETAKDPAITDNKGAATYQYKVKGADDSTYLPDKPSNAGKYTVKAIFVETVLYKEATATADFTIAKATPKQNFEKLTTARVRRGQTLANATVTNGEFFAVDNVTALEGTFAWVDDTKEITADSTEKMKFTPADTNYAEIEIGVEVDSYTTAGGGSTATRYTIKFDADGGSSVANKTVTGNSKVTEPTAPTKEGFTFEGWYTDKELTTAYDFDDVVTKNITLYAKWTEVKTEESDDNKPGTSDAECDGTIADDCASLDFTDLDIKAWYHLNTDYVIENGIFKGTTETTFAPNDNLTRAMLVTVLYRAEGEPATNRSIPFADVDMGSYYANAVIWAQQKGIVKGVSETEFAPNDNITREQIAAILYRYAIYKGMDAVDLSENLAFTDVDKISEYAISALNWATKTGLIKGYEDNTVRPLNNATRAETAALLQRFIEANK